MRCGCQFEYTGSYLVGFRFVNDADTLCARHKRSLLRKLNHDDEWKYAMLCMEARSKTYTTEELKEKLRKERAMSKM